MTTDSGYSPFIHFKPLYCGPCGTLQGLEALGCVRRLFLKQPQQAPSLFSRPVLEEEVAAPKLSEAALAFYEPTLACTLRMGRIFPYERNWSKWV